MNTPATAGQTSTSPVDYQTLRFGHRRASELDKPDNTIHPVVVVGAGPVGLAAAIDLAQQGVPVVIVDSGDSLSVGSRAVCYSKRALEIFGRLGCGQRMVDKGVSWNVGKVYLQDDQVCTFNLLPEPGHQWPAFINLQQYYLEGYMVERAQELEAIDIRWKNEVVAVEQQGDCAVVSIDTPDGRYQLKARYVIAADGARSPVRQMLGLESKGRIFRDRFLIVDVKMNVPFPAERWFWFDPPFHRNQSVLLHQQADNVWRVDFQLGWDADPEAEKQPERVLPRVRALLGKDADFDLEWVSVYTFACERMENFRHGRVLFVGDAAHRVSPFGARGANSGVQDTDNLVWKLRLVLNGAAPDTLLDTYGSEREYAADENLLNSTRATDFITPKSAISKTLRNATLKLARRCPFAQRLVNSGRLSVPAVLHGSRLSTPDRPGESFGGAALGAVCPDAPMRAQGQDVWLLAQIHGRAFTGIYFCPSGKNVAQDLAQAAEHWAAESARSNVPLRVLAVVPSGTDVDTIKPPANVTLIEDPQGLLAQRLDAWAGSFYLLRPDQHLCARCRNGSAAKLQAALKKATCTE
jgi:3-(3-hydroxy-phenyl)propionate hydroxylase